jgi:hypothetical protein
MTDTDRLRQKAKLCEQLSKLLEVPILRLRKIGGREPMYLMDLENGCIDFPTVGKLTSQKFVSDKLAGEMGKLIPISRGQRWRQIAQMMLNACIEEEATDDLKLKGAARIHVERYLSQNPFILSLEGQTDSSRHKPMIDDGKIVISSTDLQIFTNKETMQNLSVKEVASMLAALGAKAVRIRRNSFKEQSRWALPVNEFDPKDYPGPPQEGSSDGD